jgi:hypothetical protein
MAFACPADEDDGRESEAPFVMGGLILGAVGCGALIISGLTLVCSAAIEGYMGASLFVLVRAVGLLCLGANKKK